MRRRLLQSLTPDLSPLHESRDYRLLATGMLITGLGTQAALVALPYQVYVESHEPVLVGLLGLVELVPLVAASLFGGAWADRVDRRRLLLLVQIALVAAGARPARVAVGRGSASRWRGPAVIRRSGCSTCWRRRWPARVRSSA